VVGFEIHVAETDLVVYANFRFFFSVFFFLYWGRVIITARKNFRK